MSKNNTGKRKLYFRALKKIMKIKYKQPRFVYLGEEITNGALILSNHEGTDAPMSLEIYLNKPIRMWGAHEMNSGVVRLYKYQTKVYYHEKKHWNIYLARIFCLLASPLTNLFYSGLNLISTYRDVRVVKTIRESIAALNSGENVVVFPENSEKGYLEELEGFHEGFTLLGDVCRQRGTELPIFVTYYRKRDNTYIIDRPVMYSSLVERGLTRTQIANKLCERCNELGKMEIDENGRAIEGRDAQNGEQLKSAV